MMNSRMTVVVIVAIATFPLVIFAADKKQTPSEAAKHFTVRAYGGAPINFEKKYLEKDIREIGRIANYKAEEDRNGTLIVLDDNDMFHEKNGYRVNDCKFLDFHLIKTSVHFNDINKLKETLTQFGEPTNKDEKDWRMQKWDFPDVNRHIEIYIDGHSLIVETWDEYKHRTAHQ